MQKNRNVMALGVFSISSPWGSRTSTLDPSKFPCMRRMDFYYSEFFWNGLVGYYWNIFLIFPDLCFPWFVTLILMILKKMSPSLLDSNLIDSTGSSMFHGILKVPKAWRVWQCMQKVPWSCRNFPGMEKAPRECRNLRDHEQNFRACSPGEHNRFSEHTATFKLQSMAY